MKQELIKLKNVTLKYHSLGSETLTVDDISFKVYKNEFLSIVGPSGCGKSTILSMISGLIKPSAGEILIGGKCRGGAACDNVGYMFQRDLLFPWRTLKQNVFLGLEIKNKFTKENKDHAVNLLKKYSLENFLNHYPGQISGGMRQKAALIRTLAVNPEILLLDEPFSALDYQTRILISEEVREIITAEKKTAILVTHDIAEAISLSSRVLILSSRPSKIKKILEINFEKKDMSSFERRKDPKFNEYFEIIWNEMKK